MVHVVRRRALGLAGRGAGTVLCHVRGAAAQLDRRAGFRTTRRRAIVQPGSEDRRSESRRAERGRGGVGGGGNSLAIQAGNSGPLCRSLRPAGALRHARLQRCRDADLHRRRAAVSGPWFAERRVRRTEGPQRSQRPVAQLSAVRRLARASRTGRRPADRLPVLRRCSATSRKATCGTCRRSSAAASSP